MTYKDKATMHFGHPVLFLCGVQGGEDPYDALSCKSFFAKEPLFRGLCCGK